MLFNSLTFLVFAAGFFSLWPLMKRGNNRRWLFIIGASFLFYGWWDWRFLFLISGSGLLDFFAGRGMARFPRWRKFFLVLSLGGNLGSLATFKYSAFLAGNLDTLLSALGLDFRVLPHLPHFTAILPVGISFYTFQSLSYTIDVYRGRLQPVRSLLHFFAFLSMFPQLIAGPIVRAEFLLPQLETAPPTTEEKRWEGMRLIVHGYFKKVVIADNLAVAVNAAFTTSALHNSAPYWWIIISMFAFQIYCDFSGYSDIARGLAKWMGYEFTLNFNHPYTSTSVREFWTRWHISLSTWFRDYVFIPLGGSRAGKPRYHLNMWITMVASGLWHGAAWTFVIWGALHAFYLSVERLTNWPDRVKAFPGGRFLASGVILAEVWIAWVFFRAKGLDQALHIVGAMFNFTDWSYGASRGALLLLGVAAARELYFYLGLPQSRLATAGWRRYLDPVVVGLMIVLCVYLRGPGAAFIYFQF